jgi:hypothetical protein
MRNILRRVPQARRLGWLESKRWRQRVAAGVLGARQKHLVFVAGVQRSGTNMIMDLLEVSLATEVFHEIDSRAFDNYELRAPEVLAKLVRQTPAPLSVFKALCECQDVAYLLDRFISARCVWVYRHYRDVAASHVKLWSGMPGTIRRLCESGHATDGWRGRGMSCATRDLLRSYWHEELNNESACALFWYFRNQLYFEQGLAQDPRVRLLNYDALLEQPHDYAGALYDFAGLTYLSDAGNMVKTPSSRAESRSCSVIDPPILALCDDMLVRLRAERQVDAATAEALSAS